MLVEERRSASLRDNSAANHHSLLKRILSLGLVVIAITAFASWSWMQQTLTADTDLKADPDRTGLNAPYIKTADSVTRKMVEMADLTADDVVYDLGCGDGRLVIAAVEASGCRGVGIDIDPERVAEARENVKRHGLEELIEIRQQDLFETDLSESTCVLVYLLGWMNRRLIPQYQQMEPGSRIVSHEFGLGNDITQFRPDETASVVINEEGDKHHVHKWITPIKMPPAGTSPE